MRRPAAVVVALALALVLVAGALLAPASGDASTQLQTARDQLANCVLLADSSTGEQKARAEACITDQTAIVALLTGPAPTTPPATATPTPVPTTPGPTVAPTTTPPAQVWPSPATTGTPAGWVPRETRTGTWRITVPGVYEDVRVNGSITIAAAGVTLRRVSVWGGIITNESAGRCWPGLVLEQVTVRPASGSSYLEASNGAIGPGGYTARKVAIFDSDEGFRVSGQSVGCGKTILEDSFVRIRQAAGRSTHADGVQLYDGGALDVRNVTIDWQVGSGTTAFFAPGKDGNTGPVKIDRLLVKGGGHALTLGVPGSVTGYRYVAGSAVYSPGNVRCDRLTSWEARTVTIGPDYQVTADRGALACPGGSGI